MPNPFELMLSGRLTEAEAALRAALVVAPDDPKFRYGLGVTLLGLGRYAEGAPLYELRASPDLPWPRWAGEDLGGKRLVIFPEQGLGDQICFARFAPVLAAAGCDVTLFCAPQLVRLFEPLGVRVMAGAGAVDFPEPDLFALANSLICCVRSPADVPGEPYLFGRARGRGGIGIKTSGNPAQHNNANRSLPAGLAAELLNLPGAVSLEPEDTGAEDLQDTADIIAGLDLVISVCTSVAHLAGAMGKPVRVLLPAHDCDWRWMRGRSDSPWYPSATLYRQETPGDWSVPLGALLRDLHQPADL